MTISSAGEIAEHYEALRITVLTRCTSERRGLALFVRDGMAAWVDAWTSCATSDAATAATDDPRLRSRTPIAASSAIVSLLASMALSTLQESPS